MSRSGYTDDTEDYWATIRWRGAVNSAIKGKRGQQFLKELLAALDALPEKKLIANNLVSNDGAFCALGTVGRIRGIDMREIDAEDSELVAKTFNIADALAREIVYVNDECAWEAETPEERFTRVRTWVFEQIIPQAAA